MKGMTTCKVCGRDFPLMAEEHYIAQDPQKVGAFANLISTDRAFEFDAFDCPHCGCQNVMQGRKPVLFVEGEILDHDGCVGCKHEACTCEEEPCKSCKYNHPDNYRKEDNNE